MALQSITELISYSSFFDILVFVCHCLSHVFVIVFVFSIFTITPMTFSQTFLWHPRIPARSTASDVKMHRGWGGVVVEVTRSFRQER